MENVDMPYQFNTKYTDEESGLVYYGYRFYDSGDGRWLNRDPIGVNGGINVYNSVSNNMVNGFSGGMNWSRGMHFYTNNISIDYGVDLFGESDLVTENGKQVIKTDFTDKIIYFLLHGQSINPKPSLFHSSLEKFNNQSGNYKANFFKMFKDKYSKDIKRAATKNCIPIDLLTVIVLNEVFDFDLDDYLDHAKPNPSIGITQIVPTTLKPYLTPNEIEKLVTKHSPKGKIRNVPSTPSPLFAIQKELDLNYSFGIEGAARIIKDYLDKMCADAKDGKMSNTFNVPLNSPLASRGCTIKEFCCRKNSCKKVISMDVPLCLIERMAAAYNQGKVGEGYTSRI